MSVPWEDAGWGDGADEDVWFQDPATLQYWYAELDGEGNRYYVNASTWESAWELPEGAVSAGDGVSGNGQASAQWETPRRHLDSRASASSKEASAGEAEPVEWEKFVDEEGRECYFSFRTGKTTYTVPESPEALQQRRQMERAKEEERVRRNGLEQLGVPPEEADGVVVDHQGEPLHLQGRGLPLHPRGVSHRR